VHMCECVHVFVCMCVCVCVCVCTPSNTTEAERRVTIMMSGKKRPRRLVARGTTSSCKARRLRVRLRAPMLESPSSSTSSVRGRRRSPMPKASLIEFSILDVRLCSSYALRLKSSRVPRNRRSPLFSFHLRIPHNISEKFLKSTFQSTPKSLYYACVFLRSNIRCVSWAFSRHF
jgi:hypothetical protein